MIDVQKILAGIDALGDELMQRADEMEEARLLPADLAMKLARTGAFRLITPESLDGPELTPTEFVECLERIALSNAAAAWCAMIASTAALNAAFLPKDMAVEIYGDPEIITGGVFAPMGKAVIEGDDYRVSGRWSWGSGSANCTWIAGGCTIWQDGEMLRLPSGAPDTRMMMFPADDVVLHDTWHVMGLKGTGSGDFEVKDCLVPKQRSVSLVSDEPRETGALYKFPVFGLLSLGIAGVALGNGRAAIEAFQELSKTKKGLGDRSQIQSSLAEMEADLRAARAYLFSEAARVWEVAKTSGAEIPVKDRADLRLACTDAVRKCADICRKAYDLGGGSALFSSHDLQLRFRDSHAITQHIMIGPGTYEMVGKVLLDKPVNTSMI